MCGSSFPPIFNALHCPPNFPPHPTATDESKSIRSPDLAPPFPFIPFHTCCYLRAFHPFPPSAQQGRLGWKKGRRPRPRRRRRRWRPRLRQSSFFFFLPWIKGRKREVRSAVFLLLLLSSPAYFRSVAFDLKAPRKRPRAGGERRFFSVRPNIRFTLVWEIGWRRPTPTQLTKKQSGSPTPSSSAFVRTAKSACSAHFRLPFHPLPILLLFVDADGCWMLLGNLR